MVSNVPIVYNRYKPILTINSYTKYMIIVD